jgi:glycosyltransferase involved in cell wall biosynthesis
MAHLNTSLRPQRQLRNLQSELSPKLGNGAISVGGSRSFEALRGFRRETRKKKTSDTIETVSVIIPVLNNPCQLRLALCALMHQTFPRHRYEVIVVNNGQPDDLSGFEEEFPWVTFVCEPVLGSYNARNTGLRFAKGQVIAFTDSDCIPSETWIKEGALAVCESDDIGLVGGRIEMFCEIEGHPNACELYDMAISFPQKTFVEKYRYGVTANLFTTRRVVEEVGVFNGKCQSGGDCEWGVRVHRSGFRQIYSPKTVVRHPARKRATDLVRKARRVTIGTMDGLERLNVMKQSRYQYVLHHAFRRPRQLWSDLGSYKPGTDWVMKTKVLMIYYTIKLLQLGERARAGRHNPA